MKDVSDKMCKNTQTTEECKEQIETHNIFMF